MFLIVFTLLVLHRTEAISIDSLESVYFNSTNLQNVVVWNHGIEGTRYTVEYAIYGDEDKMVGGQLLWRPVKHCTSTLINSCDLSDQTHKLYEAYYARVRAMMDSGVTSNWTMTQKFEPLLHTALGPPQFTVQVSGNSLDINLRGPMRWQNKHMKKGRSMQSVIDDISYNITVYSNTSRNTRHIITNNQSYRLVALEYDTLYCISAGTWSQYFPLQSHSSEWQCEKTQIDPFQRHMLLVILGGLLPSAIFLSVLILVVCFVYHYIYGNKQRQPRCTSISPRKDHFAPEMPADVISTNMHKPNLLCGEPPPPSYSPQQPADSLPPAYKPQSWPSSGDASEVNVPLHAEFQEDEDEMPPDYGFVIHPTSEESTGVGNDSIWAPQPPAPPVSRAAHYMAQSNTSPSLLACQSSPGDEEGPTLVDWNPSTGILHIPELKSLPLLEARLRPEEEDDIHVPTSIFSSLVVRQPSQESCGPEDDLIRMEITWQLHVNMDE